VNFLRRPTTLLWVTAVVGIVATGIVVGNASSGSGNGIAPYKQAMLDKVQHDQQAAQNLPHGQKDPTMSRPTDAPSAAPLGIFPFRGFGPFPGGLYDITNLASIRTSNGNDLIVYAGAMANDPSQGILIVVGHAGDGAEIPANTQKVYPSPLREGALTVTGLGSDSITFNYLLGRGGSFNVLSRRFN